MDQTSLETLLRKLAAAGIIGEARPCGENYFSLSCPFAKWKHNSGEDSRPSATVSFGDGKSVLRCHACGIRMDIAKAVATLNDLNGGVFFSLAEEAVQGEKTRKIQINGHKKETNKPGTNYLGVLKTLLKKPFTAQAKQFLKRKNVPLTVARKFYCAYVDEYEHPAKRPIPARNVILFPVLSRIGENLICAGAQVRPLDAGPDDLKYYTIFPFTAYKYLFGEHLLPLVKGKRLFIVEGGLDTMHLWSVKTKAVGLFGLYMSAERAEKIKAAKPKKVFILLDPDQNDKQTRFKIQDRLGTVGVAAEVIESDQDPKNLSKEDFDNF